MNVRSALPTVAGLLAEGYDVLQDSRSGRLDAQLLLGAVLHRSRSWVLAHREETLTPPQAHAYRSLVGRRRAGEPVAYLRGHVEWLGLDWTVTPDVLIPRPDTELLVERALVLARQVDARYLVDIGTGSGAIACALARFLPLARIGGVDTSEPALGVARHNAGVLGVSERITWYHGSLMDPITEAPDIVVANLPYLSTAMMAEISPDVAFEPREALHGGDTGLELYARLLNQLHERRWLPGVLFEIDPRQTRPASAMVRERWPDAGVSVLQDLAGRDRVVVALLGGSQL